MSHDKDDVIPGDAALPGAGAPSTDIRSRKQLDSESLDLRQSLIELRKQEHLTAQQAADQAARLADAEKDQENFKEAQELWKKFFEAAAGISQESKKGYSTGTSTLLQLAALCELAAKANWKESGPKGPYIKVLCDAIKEREGWYVFKQTLLSLIPFIALSDGAIATAGAEKEVNALSIQHHLDFEDVPGQGVFLDKHLFNQPICLSNGMPLSEQDRRRVDLQMQVWLLDHDFQIDSDTARITSVADPARLVSADELRTLRDDPTDGLTAYLHEKFKIPFTAEATHSPSLGMG